jgi:hypothetical protein
MAHDATSPGRQAESEVVEQVIVKNTRDRWRQNSLDDAVLPANVAGDLEDEDDDCVSDEEVMDAESTDGDD